MVAASRFLPPRPSGASQYDAQSPFSFVDKFKSQCRCCLKVGAGGAQALYGRLTNKASATVLRAGKLGMALGLLLGSDNPPRALGPIYSILSAGLQRLHGEAIVGAAVHHRRTDREGLLLDTYAVAQTARRKPACG